MQTPPLRKLGVFELDEFFPPDDRTKLALRLNGLLASPAFAAWGQGDALDIGAILRPGGKPACAIVSLAHLSDEERQFVVTLVLSKLVTWMRSQPGTDQLRALVYFDEVVGFVPPTAAPPAKAPILTILKQARAFGVGLVLATQNPVDVDYKALSNAGTWMIGRLQTEQDKARLLDGLSAADGRCRHRGRGSTRSPASTSASSCCARPARTRPTTFTSRWAMSYLRGPLTREQISRLMADRRVAAAPTSTPAAAPHHARGRRRAQCRSAARPRPDHDTRRPDRRPRSGFDATPIMPTVADGIPVRWLDPAAPWAAQVGAVPTGTQLAAAIVATAELLFDDTKADLRHTERLRVRAVPACRSARHRVARGRRPRPPRPAGARRPPARTYVIPDAKVKTKALFTGVQKGIVDHLLAHRTVTLFSNRELQAHQPPRRDRRRRSRRAATRPPTPRPTRRRPPWPRRYEARVQRARDALTTAHDRVEQAQAAKESRRNDELLSGAGDLLGSHLRRSPQRPVHRRQGRTGGPPTRPHQRGGQAGGGGDQPGGGEVRRPRSTSRPRWPRSWPASPTSGTPRPPPSPRSTSRSNAPTSASRSCRSSGSRSPETWRSIDSPRWRATCCSPVRCVDTVVFRVHSDNLRSRRAVEKLGATLDSAEGDNVAYRLSAQEWADGAG